MTGLYSAPSDGTILLSSDEYILKDYNGKLLTIKEDEVIEVENIIEVENLYASILPTSATVYFVDDAEYITDGTCITNQIGDSSLKLKLKGDHLIVEV